MKRGFRLVCTGPCGLWLSIEPDRLADPDLLNQVLHVHGWSMAVATYGSGKKKWEELACRCPNCTALELEPVGYDEVEALQEDLPRRLAALGRPLE